MKKQIAIALVLLAASLPLLSTPASATRLYSSRGWIGPGGMSARNGVRVAWGYTNRGNGVWISCNPGMVMCWSIGGHGWDSHWLLIWPKYADPGTTTLTDSVMAEPGSDIQEYED